MVGVPFTTNVDIRKSVVDVAQYYNIDTSGSTDVSTALNAAIVDINNAGGKVYLTSGTYNLGSNTLTIPLNCEINLHRNANIRRTAAPGTAAPIVSMASNTTFVSGRVTTTVTTPVQQSSEDCAIQSKGTEDVLISGVTIDGNSGKLQVGISLETCKNSVIERCKVKGVTNRCYYVYLNCSEIRIVKCYADGIISQNVSFTSASPTVVTIPNHGLYDNHIIRFAVFGGSLPAGITADTKYYVKATNKTTNTFEISLTPGGASINTTTTGSGTLIARLDCSYGYNVNPGGSSRLSTNIVIDNCTANTMESQCFEFGDQCYYSSMVNCYADGSLNVGFLFQIANSGVPQYNTMINCKARNCAEYGFRLHGIYYADFTSIKAVSCKVGMYFTDSQFCVITGAHILNGTSDGIYFGTGCFRHDLYAISVIGNAGYGLRSETGNFGINRNGRLYNNTAGNELDGGSGTAGTVSTA
jgi:hypothetical protein